VDPPKIIGNGRINPKVSKFWGFPQGKRKWSEKPPRELTPGHMGGPTCPKWLGKPVGFKFLEEGANNPRDQLG